MIGLKSLQFCFIKQTWLTTLTVASLVISFCLDVWYLFEMWFTCFKINPCNITKVAVILESIFYWPEAAKITRPHVRVPFVVCSLRKNKGCFLTCKKWFLRTLKILLMTFTSVTNLENKIYLIKNRNNKTSKTERSISRLNVPMVSETVVNFEISETLIWHV